MDLNLSKLKEKEGQEAQHVVPWGSQGVWQVLMTGATANSNKNGGGQYCKTLYQITQCEPLQTVSHYSP